MSWRAGGGFYWFRRFGLRWCLDFDHRDPSACGILRHSVRREQAIQRCHVQTVRPYFRDQTRAGRPSLPPCSRAPFKFRLDTAAFPLGHNAIGTRVWTNLWLPFSLPLLLILLKLRMDTCRNAPYNSLVTSLEFQNIFHMANHSKYTQVLHLV